MNMKNKFTIILLSLSFSLSFSLTSCVDTVLLPDDKTVDEDFWQTKDEVSEIVNKAYQSMLSTDLMSRLIVWSDFRSDELDYVTSINNGTAQDLQEISTANIQTDNMFNSWGSLYSVINYCNIVLEKAENVMTIDPNYRDGDYMADRSQVLALRALAYFYLVRVFRDVPVTPGAYMNSSQELDIEQVAPATVIDQCIADLTEAEKNAIQTSNFSDWRRVGYITKDGVNAILADVYLWRASVMHNIADYEKCIELVDKIVKSKDAYYKSQPHRGQVIDETDTLHLAEVNRYYEDIFGTMNSQESVLEWQFSNSNSNTGLCQMYYKTSASANTGYMKAPPYYGLIGTNNVYTSTYDQRAWESIFGTNGTAESFDVRKMIAQMGRGTSSQQARTNDRNYNNYAQNWIVYRLTDLLLMKAEALIQLTAKQNEETGKPEYDNDNIHARQAFNIVQAVNSRALATNAKSDSLKWNTYKSSDLEQLVLQERARELCFEGKRWFDLLRYNYRHAEGVRYDVTFNEQGEPYASNYAPMLDIMIKKYASGGNAVKAKMPTEPYLYMPIIQSEIDVNKKLNQNPVYFKGGNWEKQ